jgi:hypothetical protein
MARNYYDDLNELASFADNESPDEKDPKKGSFLSRLLKRKNKAPSIPAPADPATAPVVGEQQKERKVFKRIDGKNYYMSQDDRSKKYIIQDEEGNEITQSTNLNVVQQKLKKAIENKAAASQQAKVATSATPATPTPATETTPATAETPTPVEKKSESTPTTDANLGGRVKNIGTKGKQWVNKNGELHRTDGPAIEWADGTKYWYVNGNRLTEEEFNAQYGNKSATPATAETSTEAVVPAAAETTTSDSAETVASSDDEQTTLDKDAQPQQEKRRFFNRAGDWVEGAVDDVTDWAGRAVSNVGNVVGEVFDGDARAARKSTKTPAEQEEEVKEQKKKIEKTEEDKLYDDSDWTSPGKTKAFRQEDFYPNQGPLVGQYSTGTEYVAMPGRLPMGAISKAATILNNRQAEHDEKKKAFIEELYKPIKTASAYQQDFNRISKSYVDNFVKSVADAETGGNINKAYIKIYKNPKYRAQFRQLSEDLEAIAKDAETKVKQATDFLEKSFGDKRPESSNPKTRQLMMDVINGSNEFGRTTDKGELIGDISKLRKDYRQLDMIVNRDAEIRTNYLPTLKETRQKVAELYPEELGGTGRFRFHTTQDRLTWEKAIDEVAQELTRAGYGTNDGNENDYLGRYEDNKKHLEAIFSDSFETKQKVIDTQRGQSNKGGSKGAKVLVGDAEEKNSAVNPNQKNIERVPISTSVSGRTVPFEDFTFTREEGGQEKQVTMYPVYIEKWSDGEFYIVGRSAMDTENRQGETGTGTTSTARAQAGNVTVEGTQGSQRQQQDAYRELPFTYVPVKGNEASLDNMLQGVDWRKKFRRQSRFETDASSGATPAGGTLTTDELPD